MTTGAAASRHAPRTLDAEERSVEVSMGVGAPVLSGGFTPDGRAAPGGWVERLNVRGTRLDRLAKGPVLLDHRTMTENVVGTIVGARREGEALVGRVRFGRGEKASAVYQDVTDGILSQVSVGYQVNVWHRLKEDEDGRPVYLAHDWTPYEVSFVAIGADGDERVREAPTTNKGHRTMNVAAATRPVEGAEGAQTGTAPAVVIDRTGDDDLAAAREAELSS